MLTMKVGFFVLGQATSSEVDKRKLWRVNCCFFPLKFYSLGPIWKQIINRFVYNIFKWIPLPQVESVCIPWVFPVGIHYVVPQFGNKTGVGTRFMVVPYVNWGTVVVNLCNSVVPETWAFFCLVSDFIICLCNWFVWFLYQFKRFWFLLNIADETSWAFPWATVIVVLSGNLSKEPTMVQRFFGVVKLEV